MLCCGEYEVIAESLLISAQTSTTTSEYGIIQKRLVATRTSEQKASSATSFSSFPKSTDWWTVNNKDEVNTRVINFLVFHIILISKVMHFVFLFQFS